MDLILDNKGRLRTQLFITLSLAIRDSLPTRFGDSPLSSLMCQHCNSNCSWHDSDSWPWARAWEGTLVSLSPAHLTWDLAQTDTAVELLPCCDQLCPWLASVCLSLLSLSPHTAVVSSGLPTVAQCRPGPRPLSWILIGLAAWPGHPQLSPPVANNILLLHSRPGVRLSTLMITFCWFRQRHLWARSITRPVVIIQG